MPLRAVRCLTPPSSGHTTAGRVCALRQDLWRRCVPLMLNVRHVEDHFSDCGRRWGGEGALRPRTESRHSGDRFWGCGMAASASWRRLGLLLQHGDRGAARGIRHLSFLRQSVSWHDEASKCRLSRMGVSSCLAHVLPCDRDSNRFARVENSVTNVPNKSVNANTQRRLAASPRRSLVAGCVRR